MKIELTQAQVKELAAEAAQNIRCMFPDVFFLKTYAIPRGGVPAAYAINTHLYSTLHMVDDPAEADLFVDDLIDSGETLRHWKERFPDKPFFVLLDKQTDERFRGKWIVFPWEKNESSSFEDNIRRILQFVGEDVNRGGLIETPARVVKAWKHWSSGYAQDPKDILKVFDDGAENYDQVILVKDIPVYSHCEHHLAPFFGVAHVAYLPDTRIVGLSKLSRLVDIFARRLQVQERLTQQIATALQESLLPRGVGVILECRHMCMESRGIQRQGATTLTSAMLGVFQTDAPARAELLNLIKN